MSDDARTLRQAALKAIEKSDWKKALQCYQALEKLEKNDGTWPQKAGEMCRKLGRTRDALEAFARAVDVFSRNDFLVKAIACCKLILELDANHTQAQEKLASMHASQMAGLRQRGPARRLGAPPARTARPAAPLHEVPLAAVMTGARPAADLPVSPGASAMEIPIDIDLDEQPAPLPSAPQPGRRTAVAMAAVVQTPFFSALTEPQLRTLIQQVKLVQLEPGQVLFSRGDPGDALYVIASGEISVRAPREVARLGAGAFFGEIALLVDQPRTATMVATAPTQLLAADRALIGALVAESPDLLRVLLRFVRDRLLDTLVDTSPLFASFSADERRTLAGRFRFVEAQPGLRLIEEGRPSAGLFVMLAGSATVQRAGARIATVGPGDMFGEGSLLSRAPATTTVATTCKAFVLLLPRTDFNEVIMTHPQVLEYVNSLAESRPGTAEHVTVV